MEPGSAPEILQADLPTRPGADSISKLRRNWSPEQIAGWLKCTWPEAPHTQVSHEILYRSLFIQTRGILKNELPEHLRAR